MAEGEPVEEDQVWTGWRKDELPEVLCSVDDDGYTVDRNHPLWMT